MWPFLKKLSGSASWYQFTTWSRDLEQVNFKIRVSVWLLEALLSIFFPTIAWSFSIYVIVPNVMPQAIYFFLLFTQRKHVLLVGLFYIIVKITACVIFLQAQENLLSVYLYSLGFFVLYSIQGFPWSLSCVYATAVFYLLKNSAFEGYMHGHRVGDLFELPAGSIKNFFEAWLFTLVGLIIFVLVNQAIVIELWKNYHRAKQELRITNDQLHVANQTLQGKIKESSTLNQQLRQALGSQDTFISSISHELRNPLNILLGNLDILQTKMTVNGNLNEELQACKVCGEVLLSQINNLLDIAKINAGKLEINSFSTQISEFLEKFWSPIASQMNAKNLIGRLVIDKKFPLWVEIDSHRLQQILHNLVENSLKFTSRGSIKVILSWIPGAKVSRKRSLNLDASEQERHHVESEESFSTDIEEKKESIDTRGGLPNYGDIFFLKTALSFGTREFSKSQLDYNLDSQSGEGVIRIDVIDSGCGIPKESQEKLFKPFSQGDSSVTRQYGGSGLGLFIVKRIIDKMKGELQVNSILNSGTHFKIFVPALAIPSPEDDTPTTTRRVTFGIFQAGSEQVLPNLEPSSLKIGGGMRRAVSYGQQGKCVLIADDIVFNQKVLENFFETMRFDADFANNGQEALEKYKEDPHRYSLITMDIQMPVMDGITACKRIRAYEKEMGLKRIPIVVVTGNCTDFEQSECLNNKEISVNYFFRKPFRLADCRLCVQKIMSEGK